MKVQHAITGEESLFVINEHWIKYFPAVLLIIASWVIWAFCIWIGYILMETNPTASAIMIFLSHILLLVFHHAAFYHFFSVSTHQTAVTNRRIISFKQQLWVSDDVIDIPLWQVKSVEVRAQGFAQHFFNYGSLIFNGGEFPSIERVPNPYRVHAKLTPHIHVMQPALERRSSRPND